MVLSAIKNYLKHYQGLPTQCWQRIVIYFIADLCIGVYFFLSLFLIKHLHFSLMMIGFVISAYGVGKVLGGIITGKLADKISPAIISTSCLFLFALSFLLLLNASTFIEVTATAFITGVFFYGFVISNKLQTLTFCSDNQALRIKAISILYVATNLGLGSSAVLIMLFFSKDLRLFFSFATCLLLIAGLVLFYLEFLQRKNTSLEALTSDTESVNTQQQHNQQAIYLTLALVFLIGLLVVQRKTSYPIYIHAHFANLGLFGVGLLIALNPLIIIFTQVPLLKKLAQFDQIKLIGIGGFLMGIGMLATCLSFSYWLMIFACVIFTVGEMLFLPVAQLLCYQKSRQGKQGLGLGLYQSCFSISFILGPVGGSYLYDRFGGDVVWLVSGGVGLICLVSCGLFSASHKNSNRLG